MQELDCGPDLNPLKLRLPLKLMILDKLEQFFAIPLQMEPMLDTGLHQMVEILPTISLTFSAFSSLVEKDTTVIHRLKLLTMNSLLPASKVLTHVKLQIIMEYFKKLLSGYFHSFRFQVCVIPYKSIPVINYLD